MLNSSWSDPEQQRLAALFRYSILDTMPEATFDAITSLAAGILKVPIVLFSLMDKNRQWVKSSFGASITHLELDISFCRHTLRSSGILVVPDALHDDRFKYNQFVTGEPFIRFYAGVPLHTHDGFNIGTLCLFDVQPRAFSQEQQHQLTDLAALGMELMESRKTSKDLYNQLEKERQAVIAQLKDREEQYRTLARNIPDSAVYMFNQDLRYILAEGSLLNNDQVGYSKEDLEGKTLWEALPADDPEKLVSIYQDALNGQETTFERVYKERIYLSQALPARNEAGEIYAGLIITQDITQKRQTEKNLQAERDFALQVMENMGQGLVVFKTDFTIEYANSAFAKMGGFLIEELVGKTPYDLIPKDLYPRLEESLLVSLPLEGTSYESELMRKDGTIFNALIVLQAIYRDSKMSGIVGVITDVTAQKIVEQQLRTALGKEKDLSELKTRLISTASHEFRTPLSVIISSTELLEYYSQRWSEEKKVEILNRIGQSANKLTGLVEDILIYSRAEEENLECNKAKLDLVSFCHELVANLQLNVLDEKTIRMVEIGQRQETYLDQKLIGYILTNLLSNGIKYSRPGGQVTLELEWQAEEIIFRVIDTGIGIPLKDQSNLFEPFQRASNVGNISGTGFGLAIVNHSVQAHSGRIQFKSIEGSGTTFTVTIPLNNDHLREVNRELLSPDKFHQELDQELNSENVTQNLWFLEQAIDASSSGILIMRADVLDDTIIYASKGFAKLTGFSVEEVIGKSGKFLEGADRDQPGLVEIHQAVLEERECRVILRNYRKDGSLFWNELKFSPIRDRTGKVLYFVAIQNDVTDRVKAELALNQSEEKFKALVENSPDVVARIDRNARFLYINATFEKGFGGSLMSGEATGKTLEELGLSNQTLFRFKRHLNNVIKSGMASRFELVSQLPGQEAKYFEVRLVPEFSSDGKEVISALAVGRDITNLTKMNAALKASETHLSNILESITDGVIILSADWKFIYLNPQAEKLLQRPRAELLGQKIWDKFPETEASVSSMMYKQAREQMKALSFEEYYSPLKKWFEVHVYPAEDRLSIYFQDISERKRLGNRVTKNLLKEKKVDNPLE